MSRLFALEGSTDEARGALALDLKVQAPLVLLDSSDTLL